MLNILEDATNTIHEFRNNPWPFQQTFKTPLEDIGRFVLAILDLLSIEKCVLHTNEVVFEPQTVLTMLSKRSIRIKNFYKFTIEAEGRNDISELLQAFLRDWIDFLFLPKPELFAICADHDEFVTFFFPTDAALKDFVSRMEAAGFELAPGYLRECGK
jgi:hypothetical protein